MLDILTNTLNYAQSDIYNENNFIEIIDKMIIGNSFDFVSTCAIHIQNPKAIFALSEWKLSRQDILIKSDADPLIVPIRQVFKYILRDDSKVSISNITSSEKEDVILCKTKVFDEFYYENFIFYDLYDTNADDISRRYEFYKTNLSHDCISIITDLFRRCGARCDEKDLSYLKQNFFMSLKNDILYIDSSVNQKDSKLILKEIISEFIDFLIHKTSSECDEVRLFEADLCKYIIYKKCMLTNVRDVALPKNISPVSSVDRCFKMANFFLDNITMIEVDANEPSESTEPKNIRNGFVKKESLQ